MDPITLIKTKLLPPRTGGNLIERPSLKEKLDQGLRRKLILVSAPAGYGKTTLLASWLPDVNRAVAWVSLDEYDDDVMLFLQYVVAAIRATFPSACADTWQLVQAGQSPPSYLTALLINDIVAIPSDLVLVLDDYHLMRDSEIHDLIAGLIEKHLPNLLLVIATRKDPLLSLPRLRAADEMIEIRQQDLRFQAEEVEIFLQQSMGRDIEPETAVALDQYTEGWAAGLQLVALSLAEERDPAVLLDIFHGGANSFVNEYLVNEVLTQQPKKIRSFMLECAILDRLCEPLCSAVTQLSVGGQANLEWLEAANLFLIPLDKRREWYRFHHLFQELLIRQLNKNYPPNEIRALNQRASRWFADQGYIDEAIQHALKAEDIETAVTILEANDQNLLNGLDRYTLERWLSHLPEEIIWQRPRLVLAKAWLLFREYRLPALDATLDAAEAAMHSDNGLVQSQSLQGQIAALRAFSAAFQHNDHQQAISLAEDALRLLPDADSGTRGVALMAWAHAQYAMGNKRTAVLALQEIIRHPAPTGSSKVQAFIGLSFLWEKAGDLQRLSQENEQFLTLAAQRPNPNAIIAANMLAGRLHYEWNNLAQARHHFSVTYDYRYKSNFIGAFDGTLGLARIYMARGEMDKAQAILDDLRADTLALGNIGLLLPLDAFQAYLWLENSNFSRALRWARAVEPENIVDSIFVSFVASLTHAHIMIRAGSLAEVKATYAYLQSKLIQAEAEYFTMRIIQITIHLVLAYQKLGDLNEALNTLERAVTLAQPGGFIRTFVDHGSELRSLLEQLQVQTVAPAYLPQLLAAFPETTPLAARPFLATVTLLTPRELEILRLMGDGLTNQEIAAKLVISPHTVKRHASNIYNKLDVNGRLAAIYRAKELKIL
jgi:LuxR family maltose regulon positive regulatory protein